MLFIIKVVILISMIKIVLNTEMPGVCAGVYTAIGMFFGFLLGTGLLHLLLGGAIGFGLSFLYFWLLNRFQEGALFWVIAVVGAVLALA